MRDGDGNVVVRDGYNAAMCTTWEISLSLSDLHLISLTCNKASKQKAITALLVVRGSREGTLLFVCHVRVCEDGMGKGGWLRF